MSGGTGTEGGRSLETSVSLCLAPRGVVTSHLPKIDSSG